MNQNDLILTNYTRYWKEIIVESSQINLLITFLYQTNIKFDFFIDQAIDQNAIYASKTRLAKFDHYRTDPELSPIALNG